MALILLICAIGAFLFGAGEIALILLILAAVFAVAGLR